VFQEPIDVLPERKPLVVQYEVKMQKGLECGGAYLKLLTENPGEGIRAGEDFTDKTPFTIMFGPVSSYSIQVFAIGADLACINSSILGQVWFDQQG
jgi:hypothetical protein